MHNNIAKNVAEEQLRIGEFIGKLREQKGFTQAEFARSLKTSQSAVARMEKGWQNLTTETLAKISAVLNQEIIQLAGNSVNFKIEGGHKLSGRISTNSSKNAAMSLLCATLLNKGRTVLKNVPKIEEVYRMVEVLSSIGVSVKWLSHSSASGKRQGSDLEITPPRRVDLRKLDLQAATKTRSVLMLLGPLVHLLENFNLPHPGGCRLGARTVRPHLFALEKLGIKVKTTHDSYQVAAAGLKASEIVLYESGDTVTENALMAAAKISGTTVIKMASSNYMVQDLCYFLIALGVKIEGVGTSTLKIYGKPNINQNISYYLSEDPIESMLFIAIAATTNSSLAIERCPIDFLELELLKLEKMGWKYKITKSYKSYNGITNLVDIQTFPSRLVALEEKIHPLPGGIGINIDNLPFFVPIATQAKGTTLIHDWVYENRAIYYMELAKLRANIILADPYRVYVEGPTGLRAAEVICPPALRPAANILVAMLAAKGTSILRNAYSINRGYEDLVTRLKKIGAKIDLLRGI